MLRAQEIEIVSAAKAPMLMIFCLNENRAVPSESSFSYTCISVADPELILKGGGGGSRPEGPSGEGCSLPLAGVRSQSLKIIILIFRTQISLWCADRCYIVIDLRGRQLHEFYARLDNDRRYLINFKTSIDAMHKGPQCQSSSPL